jgi:DNA-binding response OmpR family regulator
MEAMNGRDKPLLLVADDEPDILELLSFRLVRGGYELITADDGEDALSKAFEHRPDLAVLDIRMPKLDGYAVTEALRKDSRTQRMPIILLTARVQDADVERGFMAGADDYIKKPFNPSELYARIQASLNKR